MDQDNGTTIRKRTKQVEEQIRPRRKLKRAPCQKVSRLDCLDSSFIVPTISKTARSNKQRAQQLNIPLAEASAILVDDVASTMVLDW
jgi:hypothetical protein